ncbi:MAG: class I SAM-dependent methyltransferase, partial [Lachnospiraceae bacterium]|nr:class I SAM-dependent methyltransferase [Lachnospiraceae bacterium]
MHNKTIEYYNLNTKEFVDRTLSRDVSLCRGKFMELLESGMSILDAGCGSGRDSKIFLENGFLVQAIDASEKMCQVAEDYIGQPVKCMFFEELDDSEVYDGVWACASLLHLKKKELPAILARFHRALKTDGIIYASFRFGNAQEERTGRFFSDYTLEELESVFSQNGLFKVIEAYETEDSRPGH